MTAARWLWNDVGPVMLPASWMAPPHVRDAAIVDRARVAALVQLRADTDDDGNVTISTLADRLAAERGRMTRQARLLA